MIAWQHIDPVIATAPQGELRVADDVAAKVSPKDALAPAMQARNHAATPQRCTMRMLRERAHEPQRALRSCGPPS